MNTEKKILQKEHFIPILDHVDVLVAGGGPAGVAAAVGAARCGMKTILIERHGFLGGMWTAGLVLTLAGYNSWLKPYYRCADGVAGEWLRRAVAQGFAEDNHGWVLNSEAEGMKLVADQLIEEAGVKPLYHTWVCDPLVEDRHICGAFIENVEGRFAVLAKRTIDCTGNGDILYRSGAEWIKGETLQPLTLAFDIGNVNPDPTISHTEPRCIPIGPDVIELEGKLLRENASRRLDIPVDYVKLNQDKNTENLPLFGGPWFGGLWKDVAWTNTVRVVADGSDMFELTRAEIQGRKDAFRLLEYFKGHIPRFEQARIQRAGAQIGVRETRRLVGRYTLSGDDIRSEAEFDDAVGVGCWSIDIHPTEAEANHAMYVPKPYQIPYRSLIPEDMGNLLCAGRCISADRIALASVRVGATCAVTGHAAGVAAAESIRQDVQPADVNIRSVQTILEEQKAIIQLPQKQ